MTSNEIIYFWFGYGMSVLELVHGGKLLNVQSVRSYDVYKNDSLMIKVTTINIHSLKKHNHCSINQSTFYFSKNDRNSNYIRIQNIQN